MDKDDHPDPDPNPSRPPPPLSLPPRPPPETLSISPSNPHPVQPPPTPTPTLPAPAPATDSSPSSSHRRKRSRLTRIDVPPPPPSTNAITTTIKTEGASTSTSTPTRRPHQLAPLITRFDSPPSPLSTTAITRFTNTVKTEGASTSTCNPARRPYPLAPLITRFNPHALQLSTTTDGPSTSKTPPKKPDPSAPKITRPCSECGKTFWSWKALFGHMRCHPERQWRGINPPPHLRRSAPLPLPPPPPPPPTPSEDEREVANSLLLLRSAFGVGDDRAIIATTPARFECSSCKKTFPTHQALGGHRASHKNVKGCFAITKSGVEEEGSTSAIMDGQNYNFTVNPEMVPRLRLSYGLGLVHRCGICSKVFTSGQALGGHMRCHGEKTEEASTSSVGPGLSLYTQSAETQCGFDLNLPAEVEEDEGTPVSSSSDDTEIDLRLGL